jgi:hypothetical protein
MPDKPSALPSGAFAAPLGGSELWNVVAERASFRCQCSGLCGRTHGERCAWTLRHRRMFVAPRRPTGKPHVDAAAPLEDMALWCQDCLAAVMRELKRVAKSAPIPDDTPALF